MKEIIESIGSGLKRSWEITDVIHQGQTPFQSVVVANTAHGKTLFCDNERQSSELTQLIYHEGQIVPALLLAKKVKSVLIIGSSEGVVSQMSTAAGADRVVHVDIDLDCVNICARYLPYGYSEADVKSALDGQGPVKLVIEDAFSFIDAALVNGDRFDVISVDLPDEDPDREEQQNRLYQEDFLLKLKSLLTPEGALVTQAGNAAYWRNETLKRAWSRMNRVFSTTVYFEMDEQDWAWIAGSNFVCEDTVAHMQQRLKELSYRPQFVDQESIRRNSVAPIAVRKSLSGVYV